jgi:hypothetical protein
MLAIASRSFAPWLMQPGMMGHSATIQLSSPEEDAEILPSSGWH